MSRISIDMNKARELHRENLRRARLPLLRQLDGDYMRANDLNDQSALAVIAGKSASCATRLPTRPSMPLRRPKR